MLRFVAPLDWAIGGSSMQKRAANQSIGVRQGSKTSKHWKSKTNAWAQRGMRNRIGIRGWPRTPPPAPPLNFSQKRSGFATEGDCGRCADRPAVVDPLGRSKHRDKRTHRGTADAKHRTSAMQMAVSHAPSIREWRPDKLMCHPMGRVLLKEGGGGGPGTQKSKSLWTKNSQINVSFGKTSCFPMMESGSELAPPEEACAIARTHKRRSAQKAQEENGSSVAEKTIGQ